jgi:hypothetical protein
VLLAMDPCSPSASSRWAMTTIALCAWRWTQLRIVVFKVSDPASGPRPNRYKSSLTLQARRGDVACYVSIFLGAMPVKT